MRYGTEDFPYDKPPHEMTPGTLKKAFAAVMESKERRIGYISEHLFQAHGVRFSPASSDEEFDRLPSMIAAVGRLSDLTPEEQEARLVGSKPFAREVMSALLPKKELDGQTLGMVFDAALLWGEAFRHRYPEAEWALGGKPKSSVDFGDPVLMAGDNRWTEFGPYRELHGFVGVILLTSPSKWTLSKIMKMRAFTMGFGPDPRSESMPESEKRLRGMD